jgi:hypothetical protein
MAFPLSAEGAPTVAEKDEPERSLEGVYWRWRLAQDCLRRLPCDRRR